MREPKSSTAPAAMAVTTIASGISGPEFLAADSSSLIVSQTTGVVLH